MQMKPCPAPSPLVTCGRRAAGEEGGLLAGRAGDLPNCVGCQDAGVAGEGGGCDLLNCAGDKGGKRGRGTGQKALKLGKRKQNTHP